MNVGAIGFGKASVSMRLAAKTSRGLVPVKKVERIGQGTPADCVAFFPFDASEKSEREFDAFCHRADTLELDELVATDAVVLTDLASKTGPLFGKSLEETATDWATALQMARVAVGLQECLSKPNTIKSFDAVGKVVLEGISEQTRRRVKLNMYSLFLPFPAIESSQYAACLANLPYLKIVEDDPGSYIVVTLEKEEGDTYLVVRLVKAPFPLADEDFVSIVSYLMYGDDVDSSVLDALRTEASRKREENPRLEQRYLPKDHTIYDAPLAEDDLSALSLLLKALCTIHLKELSVDVFSASAENGYFVFGNFLASMWFRMAGNIGAVRVGYCELCGKPYSLKNSRGISRVYCSNDCRTKARNARKKEEREEIRARFISGESVEAIAVLLAKKNKEEIEARGISKEEKAPDVRSVISQLANWVELKHQVDSSLKSLAGMKMRLSERNDQGELADRCCREGIFSIEYLAASEERLGIWTSEAFYRKEADRRNEEKRRSR